jgi:hypothetical protein
MRTLLRIAVALEAIAREMQKFNEPANAKPAPVSTPVKDEQKPTAVSSATPSIPEKETPANKGKRWTMQEIHILNNLDRTTPIERICEMFGRDKKAIENVLYANWGGVRLWQQGAELKRR